ncbi:hypothetical protein [Rhizobium sp. 28DA2]|uniref:hypothetical protein n=1 Tax=Rhizobium sp. 28DA2 TaxID=3035209 RepID=UPI002B24C224|nr:hypothetical protein [Rhizobium sp. 28DA2]
MAAETPIAPTARLRLPGHDHRHHRQADHDVDRGTAAKREQIERRKEAAGRDAENDGEDDDQQNEAEFIGQKKAALRKAGPHSSVALLRALCEQSIVHGHETVPVLVRPKRLRGSPGHCAAA